jgi:hypothetical protein
MDDTASETIQRCVWWLQLTLGILPATRYPNPNYPEPNPNYPNPYYPMLIRVVNQITRSFIG